MASSKGWFNLDSTANLVPDNQYFEGDSAFSFLGLTRTQRLYGFIGWYERLSLIFISEADCLALTSVRGTQHWRRFRFEHLGDDLYAPWPVG